MKVRFNEEEKFKKCNNAYQARATKVRDRHFTMDN